MVPLSLTPVLSAKVFSWCRGMWLTVDLPQPRKCRDTTKISEQTKSRQLVAEASEGLLRLAVDLGVLLGVGQLSLSELLALVVCGTLGLAALLKSDSESVKHVHPVRTEGSTHLSTTSWYFQPTSWLRRPTVQYLRPGCSLRTRRAWGTTIFFCLS